MKMLLTLAVIALASQPALAAERMISFTWTVPPSIPEIRGQHTSVVVRVHPEGEGRTRVTLVESGWGEGGAWDKGFDYFDQAWGRVLASLQSRFDKGPVDWAPHLERLKSLATRKD